MLLVLSDGDARFTLAARAMDTVCVVVRTTCQNFTDLGG